jgi:hypothetical protein
LRGRIRRSPTEITPDKIELFVLADALPIGRQVCIHSEAVPRRSLQQPTEGKACLYLRDRERALRHYALGLNGTLSQPELDGMERQLLWAAGWMKDAESEARPDEKAQTHRTATYATKWAFRMKGGVRLQKRRTYSA